MLANIFLSIAFILGGIYYYARYQAVETRKSVIRLRVRKDR